MSACKSTGGPDGAVGDGAGAGVAVTVTAGVAGGGAAGSGIGVAVTVGAVTGGGAAAATSPDRAKPGRSAVLDGRLLSPAPWRGPATGGAAAAVCVGNKVVAVTTGADCDELAGGVHPGGGSKALFGFAARAGADATATGAGGAATGSGGGAAAAV
jgi:hypothetical protein